MTLIANFQLTKSNENKINNAVNKDVDNLSNKSIIATV